MGKTTIADWVRQLSPRLMQYGTTQYAYNESGLRIKKSGTGVNANYNLDGSMIIQSMDTTNSKIIDYHFDQNEQVIGFRFDGKEFIYQRNILGEIYGIIDISGKQFVKYEYTAFGVPTISLGTGLTANETTIAQSISEQNIYLYKGYVYDQETGLYYCQTRYYNPNIGRWISIDTISYLDPESINGLNLYAYCGNNPIMMSDPSGNLPQWVGWVGTAVILIGLAVLTVMTFGAAAPITGPAAAIVIGATAGAYIGAGVSVLSQANKNGLDNFDSFQLYRDTFGGAVAGAISAIPTGGGVAGYAAAFGLGGTGSTLGGIISGSVTDFKSGTIAFGIGGSASVLAKSAGDILKNVKVNRLSKLNSKEQSLAIRQLKGKLDPTLLKDSFRNSFKRYSKEMMKAVIENDIWFKSIVYSSISSSSLSTIPYIFI